MTTIKIEHLHALRMQNARTDWQALRFAIRQRISADYADTPRAKRGEYAKEVERKFQNMTAHLRMILKVPDPWAKVIATSLYNAYANAMHSLCDVGEFHEDTKAAYNAYEAICESQFKLIEDNLKDQP